MRFVKLLSIAFIIALGLVFATLNASTVPVDLAFTEFQAPLALVVIVGFGLGMLCASLSFFTRICAYKFKLYRLQNQLQVTQQEIKNLREIPLKDER